MALRGAGAYLEFEVRLPTGASKRSSAHVGTWNDTAFEMVVLQMCGWLLLVDVLPFCGPFYLVEFLMTYASTVHCLNRCFFFGTPEGWTSGVLFCAFLAA